MSPGADLEGKGLRLPYTVACSSAFIQQEKDDSEAPCSGSISSTEKAYNLHAQDDFPDGGMRAWLVVLGVRP